MRPPHIHFRVNKLHYKELVTQMYFAGEKYNDTDLILQALKKPDIANVIVKFELAGEGLEPGSLAGSFSITIQKIG